MWPEYKLNDSCEPVPFHESKQNTINSAVHISMNNFYDFIFCQSKMCNTTSLNLKRMTQMS